MALSKVQRAEGFGNMLCIGYHYFDSFENSDDDIREAYYTFGNTVPLTIADGVDSMLGSWGDVAQDSASFDTLYSQRKAIDSPLSISLTGKYNPGTETGLVSVLVTNTGTTAITNHKLRYAIVETVPYAWQWTDTCWYVCRKMLPDANGVTISLAPGESKPDSQSFTIDPSWVFSRIRIAAFVQNDSTKEILQGAWSLLSSFTGTEILPPAPVENNFALAQNRPNPFRGASEIAFTLPRAEPVRLAVYNAQGRLVKTLVEETEPAGIHRVTVSGLGSGVYFFRLEAQGRSLTRRAVVLR